MSDSSAATRGVANLYQEDTDGDGQGDLCDLCPADSQDQCDPNGSTAEEFSAGAGGTLETADGNVKIVIDPGDLAENTTISVTQTVPEDPQVNILIGKEPGLGKSLAVYVLEPDGLVFQNPVTVTIKADITHLNQNQRERVSLYQWNESQGAFVAVEGAACSTDEEPPGTFIKMCTAELTHFSVLAMVAPLDSDDDGIFDLFDNEQDLCPYSDLTETVTIEICETGVENVLLEGGCTVSDLIAECAVGARNHGQFVSCVAHLTNDLKSEGIIKGREKGAIQRCAAKADIP